MKVRDGNNRYYIYILYMRIWRESTDSWMTFRLPHAMDFETACMYMAEAMPDWELVNGSLENPDKE